MILLSENRDGLGVRAGRDGNEEGTAEQARPGQAVVVEAQSPADCRTKKAWLHLSKDHCHLNS